MSSGVNKRRRRPEDEDEEEEEGAGVDGYKSESEGSLSGEAEDEEEEENADSSSEFDPDLEINVEFEVRPISEENRPAIQRLLQQLLSKGGVDVCELTQLLVAQNGIGSVIQVESEFGEGSGGDESIAEEVRESGEPSDSSGDREDEEGGVCGVTSVLNLTHHRSNKAVRSLADHLLAKCKQDSPSAHPRLEQLLAPPTNPSDDTCGHVGLVVNERYLNIPPHVAPPLLKSLLTHRRIGAEDMFNATAVHVHASDSSENSSKLPGQIVRTEIKEASGKGLPYGFASYVLLARSYLVPSPLGSPPQSKKRRKEGGEETAVSSVRGDAMATLSSSCVFHNQEYEVFQEEAELTFSYPVGGGEGGDDSGGWSFEDESLQQTRTVMVLSASRLQSAIDKLSSLIS